MEWDLTKFKLCWFKTLSTSTEKLISNNSAYVEVFKDMQTNHTAFILFLTLFTVFSIIPYIKREKVVQRTIVLRVLSPPASRKFGNQ